MIALLKALRRWLIICAISYPCLRLLASFPSAAISWDADGNREEEETPNERIVDILINFPIPFCFLRMFPPFCHRERELDEWFEESVEPYLLEDLNGIADPIAVSDALRERMIDRLIYSERRDLMFR